MSPEPRHLAGVVDGIRLAAVTIRRDAQVLEDITGRRSHQGAGRTKIAARTHNPAEVKRLLFM